jgi:L,D-transpeptidase catalytic domain/Putative peptidoglycan binding domain
MPQNGGKMPDMPSNYHMSTTTTDLERPAPEKDTLESKPVEAPPPITEPEGSGRDPKPRFAFIRRHPKGIIGLLLALILLGALAFGAYATASYGDKYEDRILPGAQIAGVDVGGMGRQEAIAAVKEAIGPQFDRKIRVTWRSERFVATAVELGAMSNARATVDAALDDSAEASFFELAEMRWLGRDFDFEDNVALRYPPGPAREFIAGIAEDVKTEPKDASLDYSTGRIKVVPGQNGHVVKESASTAALLGALRGGNGGSSLEVKSTKPAVVPSDFKQALMLDQSDFQLSFYERVNGKLKVTHSWPVAVGSGGYPTPTGEYEVTELRYMPTWVNPAPDGWGASMPASIPPGPSNPLGLRAINWSASGIRFHGTSDIGSIGTPASHGCVRMYNEDVIKLYDMVEVGTPIVSTY